MTATRIQLVIGLAAGVAACTEQVPVITDVLQTPDVIALDETAQRNAGIAIAPAATITRAEQTEAPGVLALDERRTARIGSLVEGVVLATLAEVGDRVQRRQVLADIHSPIVHEAWARYRVAIADRRRLEKELAFSVAAEERARRLYEAKAIALQEVQRAEANRVGAEEGLDMGRTEVRRAEEELQHLGITNADDPSGEAGEQIPVRTPLAGVVLERLVTPGTAVTPGTPLFVVSDLAALWALVEVDESLLSHIRVGLSIDVRVAAYPGEHFSGTVEFVGDTVNPKTRRVTVRCAMQNAAGRLKPQMYATVAIRETDPRAAVVVPVAAIQTIDGRSHLFVAEGRDRFRPRAVDTGAEADGLVEVRAGLQPGERIAVSGTFALKAELLKAVAPPEE